MSRYLSAKYQNLTPYVPGEQPQDRSYIKLNTNESPFPPSPLAQRLAREAAGDLQLYSDPEVKALRDTAADYYGVGIDELMFGNGSDENLNYAFMAFCDAETPAIFADITYGIYPVYARLNQVPYRQIPLKEDYTLDIGDYMSNDGTIFIANPNAPTGIALPKESIRRILEANPDHIVLIDEAYVDFGGESCVDLIHSYRNLVVTQTFSKSRSLAGGRLGVTLACPELITDMQTLRNSTNPYNINRMTMAAAIGALLDRDYFLTNCRRIARTREKTAEALRSLGFDVLPSCSNFLFARHSGISGHELYQTLKDNGILVRYFDKPRLRDFVRITVGSDEQMRTLLETIAKLWEGRL